MGGNGRSPTGMEPTVLSPRARERGMSARPPSSPASIGGQARSGAWAQRPHGPAATIPLGRMLNRACPITGHRGLARPGRPPRSSRISEPLARQRASSSCQRWFDFPRGHPPVWPKDMEGRHRKRGPMRTREPIGTASIPAPIPNGGGRHPASFLQTFMEGCSSWAAATGRRPA